MSLAAEAGLLQMRPDDVKQHCLDVGAGVYFMSRSHLITFCSTLLRAIDLGMLKPIVSVAGAKYDETALPLGLRKNAGERVRRNVPWKGKSRPHRAGQQSREIGGRLSKQDSKILQMELRFLFVCKTESGSAVVFDIGLPQPLRNLETCSGRTILSCLLDALDMPILLTLRRRFPFNVDVSVSDNAGSNNLAERAMRYVFRPEFARFSCKCQIHKLHTVTGKIYQACGNLVTGAIAMGLSMKAAGSSFRFRAALEKVFKSRVVFVPNGAPPPVGSPQHAYRTALFDLCVPSLDHTNRQRRLLLEYLLNGDLRVAKPIEVYITAGSMTVDSWASDLASCLCPSALGVFPRGRWCSSLGILDTLCLLVGCHQLLRPTVEAWLEDTASASSSCGAFGAVNFEGIDQAEAKILAIVADSCGKSADDSTQFWQAFNTQKRNDALKFVKTVEAGSLLTSRTAS